MQIVVPAEVMLISGTRMTIHCLFKTECKGNMHKFQVKSEHHGLTEAMNHL